MMPVNVHEAKSTLSKLLARVEAGEEVIIARAGKPVARLVPMGEKKSRREPGRLKGKIWVADDFDDPLPDDILRAFYGDDR